MVVLGRQVGSCGALREALVARGHQLSDAADSGPEGGAALELVRTRRADVVLLDLGGADGLLDRVRELGPGTPVVALGREDTARAAADAAARGAFGYVVAGAPDDDLAADAVEMVAALVDRAAARTRVEASRRQALEESLRTRKFYEDVLTSVGQGILVVDRDGQIRFLNPEARRILGEEDVEDVGAATGGGAVVPLLEMLVETLSSKARQTRRIALEAEDEKVFLDVTTSVLRGPDGLEQGAIAIVSDRSAELRLEEQLVHTERLATLGSLLASIAHEITNSLTSITGCAEMGLEVATQAEEAAEAAGGEASAALRSLSGEIRDIFDLVLQAGISAQTIANNLLQYSRRGALGNVVSQDLNDLVEQTLKLLGKHVGVDKVRLDLQLDAGRPRVRVEPSKVQQAVVNLVVNAVQAMQDVAPERRALKIATRADPEAREAALLIADRGPGIPPRRLERIWKPFFTTKGHGTGLGLHITRRVIEDQGGRISLESEVGDGTRFTIHLPLD